MSAQPQQSEQVEVFEWTEPERPAVWEDSALCAQTDPDSFFPDRGGSCRGAKRICMQCTVGRECLVHALDNDERFGVWGGKSERERRKMKQDQQ